MRARWSIALVVALLVAPAVASAQQVLLDQGARVEGLWVFPSALDENAWYYLPNQGRLATANGGDPQFSFLRYVVNRAAADAGAQGITQAEGGGILHFLVTYDTPKEVLRRAEREVTAKFGEKAELRGPVIYKSGRYSLVSSIILQGGDKQTQLLATGNAPVMEGSQIALAFELPPERATLLLESLKMDTPDITLVFEMTVEGLSDAFNADVVVRWDQVKKHEAWGVGMDLPLGAILGAATGGYGYLMPGLGGKAGGILDELAENQAIEVRTRGENANMEALVDKVVTTLVDLLFEPVPAEGEADRPGAGGLLGGGLDTLSEEKDEYGRAFLPGVGISAGYKVLRVERSGETVINMNSKSPRENVTTFAFGVGDLWRRHGKDPKFFRTVNLADPAFEQREVHVGIDGAIVPEFEAYINSVTTTLRKQHQNGKTTVQEIVVDAATFNREGNDFRMVYGWNGDEDRDAWLDYDYQTRWSFKGGGVYETGWVKTDSNMIDLYAPYRRKVVRVLGDHEALQKQGVRAVIVNVEHDFFEGRKRERLRLRPSEPIEGKTIEFTLPLDQREYDYSIEWIRGSGERVDEKGADSTGLIFVDEVPAASGGPS